MKDVVESILNHPIASLVVISATSFGIADIIRAIKGTRAEPKVNVSVNKVD